MIISHIVAMSENHVIGRAGGLPWHIPEDFKFFKKTTMGHAMIMGRKTWDSIGKALPGRLTIVITRDQTLQFPDGVIKFSSLPEALRYCEEHRNDWGDECFIVGGGDIYLQSLDLTDRLYITIVHRSIEGDTFYPRNIEPDFVKTKSEAHLSAPLPYTFTIWERVRKV